MDLDTRDPSIASPPPAAFSSAIDQNTRATTDVPARGYRTTTEERRTMMERERSGPFSWAAGFLGWGAAMFFTLVLVSVILALLGNAAYLNSTVDGNTVSISERTIDTLTWTGIVGALFAVLVGFFAGGYAAGRIDRWHGAGQGIVVVAWAVVFGLVSALIANYAAVTYGFEAYLQPYAIDWNAITTQALVGMVLTLGVMLLGAILGGMAGERWLRRDASSIEETRRSTWRGRPRV